MYRRNTSFSKGAGFAGLGVPRFGIPRLSDICERLFGASETPPRDMALVNRAAEAAAVSEFDLFQAAWQQWHGSKPEAKRLEPVFARYLGDGKAPGFVRHYARRVLDAALAGEIDPVAFGLVGYRRREALPDLSCRFSTELWTGVLLTLLVVVF